MVKQENSYYAFGLIMPNSPVGTPTTPNKQLYNGGSEWQNDFGKQPDYQQTFFRNYDAAIGRFVAVDPMAESAESMTGYQYAGNNPIMNNDPMGNLINPYKSLPRGYTSPAQQSSNTSGTQIDGDPNDPADGGDSQDVINYLNLSGEGPDDVNVYNRNDGTGTNGVISALQSAGVAFTIFRFVTTLVDGVDPRYAENADKTLITHLYVGFVNEDPSTSGLEILQTFTSKNNFIFADQNGNVTDKIDQSTNNDNSPFYYTKAELVGETNVRQSDPNDPKVYSIIFDDTATRIFLSTDPQNTTSFKAAMTVVGMQGGLYVPLISVIWGNGTDSHGQPYIIGPIITTNPSQTPLPNAKILNQLNGATVK